METKKSIFKLQKRRFIYEVQKCKSEGIYVYGMGYTETPVVDKICKFTQSVSEETLGEYEFEMPILKIGSKFYLVDIDKTIKISEIIRASNDKVLYIVNDEIIEDEVSLKSKEEAEKLLELNRSSIYDKLEKIEEENATLKRQQENLIGFCEKYKATIDETKEKYFKLKNNWFVKTFIDRK